MSKVLFVSNYRELSGYSRGAQEYILALDSAGVEVVPRPLSFGQRKEEPPSRIVELENQESYDCDVNIQYTLPHLFTYNGNFKKNIGFFATETSNFRTSAWAERCNMMDEIWVINSWSAECCRNSGVKVPVKIAKHPIDIQKCSKCYDTLLPKSDSFNFYTIGEFSRRKNFKALLTAFHSLFDLHDSVNLIIKTSVPGKSPEEAKHIVSQNIEELLKGLKLKSRQIYKKIILITDKLSEGQMMQLHSFGDCFVCTSYGEAWCIPAFEAWASGKAVIVPNYGPFQDYMRVENAWIVPVNSEPVFGMVETFGDIYTSNELWKSVKHTELCDSMWDAYVQRQAVVDRGLKAKEAAKNFSYENIGQHLSSLLNG